MLVVCPNCTSSYFVRSEMVGREGRMMRCGVCRSTFQAGSGAENSLNAVNSSNFSQILENTPPSPPHTRESTPQRTGSRFGVFAAGLAGLAGLVGVVGGMAHDFGRLKAETTQWIAHLLPGLTSPRLAFDNIRTRFEGEGANRALVIEGIILSDATTPHNLPGLRFEIRSGEGDGGGSASIFQWMIPPPAPTIDRGNPVPFRARLASPPREGKDIMIRLAGA